MRVLVAVLALLIMAAPAQAGPKIDRSLAIAQAVWHPACGQLRVAYGDPVAAGAVAEAFGWAWAGNCEVGVTNKTHLEFQQLCVVILHEGGHVVGLGHSDNPRSIMRPDFFTIETIFESDGRTITRWDGVDPRCVHGP